MEALTLGGQEAGHAGRRVGRLDQLDLRLADRQEGDPDAVVGHLLDDLELEAEDLPVEAEGGGQVADDDGNVVDPADPVDLLGQGRLDRESSVRPPAQIVISSRCSPHTARSRSLISPTVA